MVPFLSLDQDFGRSCVRILEIGGEIQIEMPLTVVLCALLPGCHRAFDETT